MTKTCTNKNCLEKWVDTSTKVEIPYEAWRLKVEYGI